MPVLLVVLMFMVLPVSAAEESIWDAEVELGAVFTSGNTDEKNFKFRGEASRDGERFLQAIHLDSLNSSKDGQKTAQKYYAYYQLDYKLDNGSFFSRVAFEDDRFSGFDYQTDVTIGYSRTLMETSTMKLTGDAGAGYRYSRLDTGGSDDEAILRFAATYLWQLSENAQFEQLLSTEIGNESTISRSESSLSSTIIGDLAMKLSVKIRNNSDVPAGRKKTDTESSVTLVYKF